MSDVMLFGVLKMPYELAMSTELSRRQFYGRVQELVARFEAEQPAQQQVPHMAVTVNHKQSFVEGLQPAQHDPWPHKWGCRANAFGECNMGCTSPQPAQQQEPVDTDWDAVLEKLIEVWNRQISADEGLDEIQDLIYTSPPNVPTARASKPWVGLTLDDHIELARAVAVNRHQIRAIESKLREKNA